MQRKSGYRDPSFQDSFMSTLLEDFLRQNVCEVLHITDLLSEIWRERIAETVKILSKLFHIFPLALGCYFKDKYSPGCLICLPLYHKTLCLPL